MQWQRKKRDESSFGFGDDVSFFLGEHEEKKQAK
jgi:hypothetical protein